MVIQMVAKTAIQTAGLKGRTKELNLVGVKDDARVDLTEL
jgi:hypothetical protein